MEFGEILKKLRKERKITQQELADILCVDKTSICKWENGAYFPNQNSQIMIADYFNVPLDYLLGRTETLPKTIEDLEDQGILSDVYFQIAKDAQDLEIPPEDIQKIIELYRKYKR